MRSLMCVHLKINSKGLSGLWPCLMVEIRLCACMLEFDIADLVREGWSRQDCVLKCTVKGEKHTYTCENPADQANGSGVQARGL